MSRDTPPGKTCLVCTDVRKFKVINDLKIRVLKKIKKFFFCFSLFTGYSEKLKGQCKDEFILTCFTRNTGTCNLTQKRV